MKKFQTAIAFGGGGARGLAGLGVIKVLEQNNLKADIIVGTSMGSLIGALYALEGTTENVVKKLKTFLESDVFKKLRTEDMVKRDKKKALGQSAKVPVKKKVRDFIWRGYLAAIAGHKLSLIGEKEVIEVFNYLLPDIDITQLPIKFAALTVDIQHAEPVLITQGSLREAVRASSSIAGIFPPVEINGNLCSDGCAASSIPIEQAMSLGSDFVIGVDVRSKKNRTRGFENLYEVVTRNNEISNGLLADRCLNKADIIIAPDVKSIHWADYGKVEELSKQGEIATIEKLTDIKKSLKKKRKQTFLRRIFKKDS